MIAFWIVVALLLFTGVGFFLPALLGRGRPAAHSREDWNLLIHRQRREELAADMLDESQAALLKAELDRDLLTDLDHPEDVPAPPALTGRALLTAGLATSLLTGVLLYLQLGRVDLLQSPTAAADRPPTAADMEAGIERLSGKLAQDPNDLDGWVLLGRSLQATGRADKAVTAYEFALKLAPDNPDLKALYAQTLAESHEGSMEGKPAQIVEEILHQDPNHPTALWLAGLAAAERRDSTKAVAYWQKLKAQLPPEGEDAQEIARYIAEVQGLAPQPAGPTAPGTATTKASIRVRVALADPLKDRARPEDTVFIFARAAEGPPMPLAIVRKQVKDLPVEVTLDDSLSMMEGLQISSFDRIVIGARISRSGQPTASPGDLQGLTHPVPSSIKSQTIQITEIVR